MYQKILVPLDGSDRAGTIMPHAIEMAQRFDAKLILLQVIEPVATAALAYEGGISPIIYEREMANLEESAKSYLANWRSKLAQKEITTSSIVEHGSVVRTILEVAAREGVDLIAMSSHGRTGLSRVFYGSVAAGILSSTNLPLLLIRSETAS